MSQAVMATGFPVKRDYSTKSLASFIQQVQRFKKVRMLGAAAIMSLLRMGVWMPILRMGLCCGILPRQRLL